MNEAMMNAVTSWDWNECMDIIERDSITDFTPYLPYANEEIHNNLCTAYEVI